MFMISLNLYLLRFSSCSMDLQALFDAALFFHASRIGQYFDD
jgi:hypothetical protein